jgi:ribosomal protein S18 acetylase RimI-like enzyme
MLIGPDGPCGTVQGMRERGGMGSIQNLGILPFWRGRGLGEALLLQALHGFCRAGLGRAQLEVTAQNDAAVRLYRRLGFRRSKTLYKAVPDWRGF